MSRKVKTVSRLRVQAILKKFSKARVLVVGDVGVDQYTRGSVTRISPEAPIPVVEVTDVRLKLGLAANVAENVTALKGKAALLGILGSDERERVARSLLKKHLVDDQHLIVDPSRPTILKERIVSAQQQLVRIDYESKHPLSRQIRRKFFQRYLKCIDQFDLVILEDYAKGLFDVELCQEMIQEARARRIPVLVDPNAKTSLRAYRGCYLMTPNAGEAEALVGAFLPRASSGSDGLEKMDLQELGVSLRRELASDYVIITRGKDGMAIFDSQSQEEGPLVMPTFAREVFDVSGAGDTVIATLGLCLCAGADLEEACFIANVAAGIEVGKVGTATVTQLEVLSHLRNI